MVGQVLVDCFQQLVETQALVPQVLPAALFSLAQLQLQAGLLPSPA